MQTEVEFYILYFCFSIVSFGTKGLLHSLNSEIIPDSAKGTIWHARDQTHVSRVQD